jgi:hypothetical protein
VLESIPELNVDFYRPKKEIIPQLWIDSPDSPSSFSTSADDCHKWRVKLSGSIKTNGVKNEGVFKPSDNNIINNVPSILWADYQGRNRLCFRTELKRGDLIWLEPENPDTDSITSAMQIKSLQWVRWGRSGESLKKALPLHVQPDSLIDDGRVDMVTELFGQVPMDENKKAAGPFTARIRPHNLIFFDGINSLEQNVALAPLMSPHPGCIGFYRNGDLDMLTQRSEISPLKGYKVYRNATVENSESAPWKYSVQGEYETNGRLKLPEQQKINKTVELLKTNQTGKLRISFRALSNAELALLLAACSVDWKLGGGKPLGLGHCKVINVKVKSEDGTKLYDMTCGSNLNDCIPIPNEFKKYISPIENRIKLYKASQKPVKMLRYPRAAGENSNDVRLEGLKWFSRHVSPKKGENTVGLQTLWTRGELKTAADNKSQIRAQNLPILDDCNPSADYLYGYDCYEMDVVKDSKPTKKLIGKLEPFVQKLHGGTGQRGTNESLNHESRQAQRDSRSITPEQGHCFTKDNAGAFIGQALQEKIITPEKAQLYLSELKQLGIVREQSKKWTKKIDELEKLLKH